MKDLIRLLAATLFILSAGYLPAQEGVYHLQKARYLEADELATGLPHDFDFFELEQPLQVRLESDFKNLVRKKFKDEYQEAFFNVQLGDSVEIRHQIRIKPRGKNRLETCSNPPIKLNFKKGTFPIESLKHLDKIKLVDYCSDGNRYEEYLLKEYLVYKLYNLLTERSFRVCLIEIEYMDTGRDNKSETKYGFLIEEGDVMGERLGLRYLSDRGVLPENTDPQHAVEQALFQYMIGNTDWSIKGKHNIKLLVGKDLANKELYAVPYDFDYCGLVNADYAVPPEFLEIDRVTQRLFRSYCSTKKEFETAFEKFQEKKDAFYQTINEFSYLDERARQEMIDYLDGFYEIISSPKKVKTTIMRECRPRESSGR